MSDARPIGEIIAPIVARAHAMAGFQVLLNVCLTSDGRKLMIMSAWEAGVIDADDAQLLIEAYQLETA